MSCCLSFVVRLLLFVAGFCLPIHRQRSSYIGSNTIATNMKPLFGSVTIDLDSLQYSRSCSNAGPILVRLYSMPAFTVPAAKWSTFSLDYRQCLPVQVGANVIVWFSSFDTKLVASVLAARCFPKAKSCQYSIWEGQLTASSKVLIHRFETFAKEIRVAEIDSNIARFTKLLNSFPLEFDLMSTTNKAGRVSF